MERIYIVRDSSGENTFLIFTFVIMLISLIHLLSRDPPEQYNHSLFNDNSKLQYITIGQQPTAVRHGQTD
jgi:hypothetical protein